jgi:branched-chain amino acid transport system ATP-binding protein
VGKEETVCLLGRNGAGKSTAIKSIMGILLIKRGTVMFDGQQLTGLKPFQVARMGVGYVPEDRRIYPDFTVRENLEIVPRRAMRRTEMTLESVFTLFPPLKNLEKRLGYQLSGGELQMLSIARALVGNPKLMLLDEPTEGLAPMVVSALLESIEKLRNEGRSVLLAEQNVRAAIKVSSRVYVLGDGIIAFEGPTNDFLKNPELVKRHLLV